MSESLRTPDVAASQNARSVHFASCGSVSRSLLRSARSNRYTPYRKTPSIRRLLGKCLVFADNNRYSVQLFVRRILPEILNQTCSVPKYFFLSFEQETIEVGLLYNFKKYFESLLCKSMFVFL